MQQVKEEILSKLKNKFKQIAYKNGVLQTPYFTEDDVEGFEEAHQLPAITSVRLNPFKPTDGLFADAAHVPWCSSARYLQERPVFTIDPKFHAGAYYVQEASSMFTGYAFEQLMQDRDEPIKVLDLCAAPGGKSTLLASLLRPQDLLIANETIQPRASILAENLTRWGQMNTWVTNNDPRDFTKLVGYFDCILIDAPCTGSGLWRKDEDAVNEWSPEHVRLCSDRQRRIIADALPALKDGGLLLYATCSYSPEENEQIADWICAEFEAESLPVAIDDKWGIVATQSDVAKAYGYRFYPWRVAGEGFFLAAFRVANNHAEVKPGKDKGRRVASSKMQPERWHHLLDSSFAMMERNEEYYAVHPGHVKEYEKLSSVLRIKKGGTRLGKMLSKEIIPDHELALSVYLRSDAPSIEMNREEALHYLKKEEIKRDGAKGWMVAQYEGLALGWGKWMPGRMNNYLPKNWRIRMDISEL